MLKAVPDYLGEDYKTLKGKYVDMQKTELAYQNHLDSFEDSAEKQQVKDYHDAHQAWYNYYFHNDMTDPAKESQAEALKLAYKNKQLPEDADPNIIKAPVKAKEDFNKYKTNKIDILDPSPKCTASNQCNAQSVGQISTKYIEADVKVDEAKVSEAGFTTVYE